MAEVKWTADQQKVIDLRNRNILVSAAAGSGKTAVLVERIITMITEGENPIDIDRLLIVTFTNAAAAEMKERIGVAIEKKLLEMPDNLHLQKQITLIHSAQITTIHSFCLNVIRNHFNQIDLDPSFRIGDEAELKLLKSDVIADILERHYEKAEEDFVSFIESYSSGKSDAVIEDLILQLYSFSMSYPWPEDWLCEKKELFQITSLEEMQGSEWMKSLMEYLEAVIHDIQIKNGEAISISNEADGPYPYIDALLSDREMIEQLKNANSYEEYANIFESISFARLSSKRAPEVSPSKKETVKAIRDEIKKSLNDISKNYFFQSSDEMLKDIMGVKTVMNVLIDLTIEFAEEYAKLKEEKNIVDFNDLEHFALRILVDNNESELKPSLVADDLSEYYEEILIDEYQDSNLVQETILNSISKERFGRPNLFMVGDVKQSIYKFRLARPELFMDKFDHYSVEESSYQRIDLHKNFRSRSVVLDTVNFIFTQIMTKKLGNIEYDEKASLYVGATFEDTDGPVSTNSEVLIVEEVVESKEEQKKQKAAKNKSQEDMILEEIEGSSSIEDYTSKELEARAIAARIKELTDPETGMLIWEKGYKRATYKDIVILLRTMSNWSDVFVDTLMREGIPAYSDTQSGYFSALEVKTILNVLRIIDNPRQDIPLVAVLRSPIVSLTSNELAMIRASKKDLDMFDAITTYAEHGEDTEIQDKLIRFLEELNKYRESVPFTSVHELILKIIDDTGYYDYVKAMPAGERRSANIDMLVEKAIQFESTSYVGLFHFIRYIEKLHKYDIDYGEAGIISENDNTVRIMSIHKSKGLEFPIVFVAGMGKQFNNQDLRSKVVLHPDLGLGPDYIDYHLRLKSPTLIKKTMQMKLSLENLAEELRVLYVALTRAKEKLIITGTVKNLEEKLLKYQGILTQEEWQIPFQKLTQASTFFDFIIPALIRHHSFSENLDEYGIINRNEKEYGKNILIDIKKIHIMDVTTREIEKQIDLEVKKNELLTFDTNQVYDEAIQNTIIEHQHYQYPYQNEVGIHAKVTVSELKKLGQNIDEEYSASLFEEQYSNEESSVFGNVIEESDTKRSINEDNHCNKNMESIENIKNIDEVSQEIKVQEEEEIVPKFIAREQVKSNTSRGTLYHKVLETVDLSKMNTYEEIELELNRLAREGKIEQSDIEIISKEKLYQFAHSMLAKRMIEAKKNHKLYTEKQFVFGIHANEINSSLQSEELVLVQGIIDAYFEEEGELVLVDYKTDQIRKGKEDILIRRYQVQLDYYQRALEQILGKKVKEKIIYSITLGKEIII